MTMGELHDLLSPSWEGRVTFKQDPVATDSVSLHTCVTEEKAKGFLLIR